MINYGLVIRCSISKFPDKRTANSLRFYTWIIGSITFLVNKREPATRNIDGDFAGWYLEYRRCVENIQVSCLDVRGAVVWKTEQKPGFL